MVAASVTQLDPLLTREDLAGYLKVSPRQVDELRPKLPPPIYIGRLPRWRASDLAEWVSRQCPTGSETSTSA